jgi:hypothetical protein
VSGVIDAMGNLYTWGKMRHSAALGLGTRLGVRQPTRVEALTRAGVSVAAVTFADQHAVAIVGIPRSL